jgi:hypothetical protein
MDEFERFLQKARQLTEPDVPGAHLSEALFVDYAYEQLMDEQAGRVAAHLIRCDACQAIVIELRAERVRLEQSLVERLPSPVIPKLVSRWRSTLISVWQMFREFFIENRPVLVHATAYAAVLLIFFWANSWLEHYLTPLPGGTAKRPPWWAPVIWYAPWVLVSWGLGLGFYLLYRWNKKKRS